MCTHHIACMVNYGTTAYISTVYIILLFYAISYIISYVYCIVRMPRWSAHIVHIHRGTYVACIMRVHEYVYIIHCV